MKGKDVRILVAEDDADDKQLLQYAFDENKVTNPVTFVNNGQELIDLLTATTTADGQCMNAIILLDLNMPKMDGREALRIIKQHDAWRKIPVVVFSTSTSDIDIKASYTLGASSYVSKPAGFEKLVEFVKDFKTYWFHNVLFAN